MVWVALIVGGSTGTVARYALSAAIHRLFGTAFPYGTAVVNMIGCLMLGFLAAVAEEKLALESNVRLLLTIGFCGAFTTFSAFILETSHLIKEGQTLHAFVNVTASVIIGFWVFRFGVFLAESL